MRKAVKEKIKMAKEQTNNTVLGTETINGNLVLERTPIMKDGRQLMTQDNRPYFAYQVHGIIRGQEKKIDFVPKDKGGYEPLDIIFDIQPKAELIISDEVMTDNDGNKTAYKAYKVSVTDEDGDLWECGVKPQRDSDKALLGFLLTTLRKELRKSEPKTDTVA